MNTTEAIFTGVGLLIAVRVILLVLGRKPKGSLMSRIVLRVVIILCIAGMGAYFNSKDAATENSGAKATTTATVQDTPAAKPAAAPAPVAKPDPAPASIPADAKAATSAGSGSAP